MNPEAQSPKLIWQTAVTRLQEVCEQATYHSWIAPIACVGGTEQTLTLRVPDRYSCDYIGMNLLDQIQRSVSVAANRPIDVQLLVADAGLSQSTPSIGSSRQQQELLLDTSAAQVSAPRDNLMNTLDFGSFVVGSSNRLAHGAALTVTEKDTPFNPLFIHGGVGIGKTHLLHAIGLELRQTHKRVLYAPAASFIDDFMTALRSKSTSARSAVRDRYRDVDVLLLDDIQFLQGKEATQEEFFHTFNALQQKGSQVVLTSDRPPADLGGFEDRLRSRFDWGLVAEISAPDLDMRTTILKRKAESMGAPLTLDVIHYIAEHLRNNVRELEGALNKLHLHARISMRRADLNLAREVLGPVMELPGQRISIDAIQRTVVKHFRLRMTDLKGNKRHRAVVEPRMIAMYLCREMTEASFPEIGRAFGDRDHSTVINACKRVKWDLSKQHRFKENLDQIVEQLNRL